MGYKETKIKESPVREKKKKAPLNRAFLISVALVLSGLFAVLLFFVIPYASQAGVPEDTVKLAPLSMRTEAVFAEPVDEFVVDEEIYRGTLLLETADAGQSYIDDTLFIGDSNTLRLYMFNLIKLKNVMGVEGMGIQSVINHPEIYWMGYSSPVAIPEAVSMTQPRRIVICFGTNNLINRDPVWFTKNYGEAITSIQEAYEYAEIIVMSVPPVGANNRDPNLSNKTVIDYNTALLDFAQERGLRFLNVYEELVDRNNGAMKGSYIEADGVHLSKLACEAVLKYARTHASDAEDTRPKPLKPAPERREAPPKPVQEKPRFSASLAAGYVAKDLLGSGFSAPAGKVNYSKAIDSLSFSFPDSEVKPGMEKDIAAAVASAVRGSRGGGIISVTGYYDEDTRIHVIAVYFFPLESDPGETDPGGDPGTDPGGDPGGGDPGGDPGGGDPGDPEDPGDPDDPDDPGDTGDPGGNTG
ncbi:MAG: GDSL-type esterase/lipase family protein [Oscillospiraceae bacterium]|nr:GDSL-type esterase/lipase family protein [Oscillospiraceae bacterium]